MGGLCPDIFPMLAHRIQLAAAAGHPAILCIHTAVTGKGMWQEAFCFVFLRSGPLLSLRNLDGFRTGLVGIFELLLCRQRSVQTK